MISFVLNEITENTPPNTVFLLHGYKYDEIDEASYDWHCVPYTNFEAARRGIIEQTRKYIADYGEDDDKTVCRWYCIGKWLPDGTGEMNNIVSWYMSNAGVVWFADINDDYSDELKQLTDDVYWNLGMIDHSIDGISIPFKEGDIVTIDNRPSLPICHAVISKILDRVYDCCGIQAIYINSDGELDQSALKHDLMGRGIGFPLFSCMYRLSKFTGELPEEETVLDMVGERIKQDPSLADDEGFLHHIAQQVNR